jgi:hypothetical protein
MVSPLAGCMPPVATPIVLDPQASSPAAPATTASAIIPNTALSTATPVSSNVEPSHVFIADADTWVDEANPAENHGSDDTLRSDGGSAGHQEAFLHFTVTGISGAVQSARLRIYVTTGSTDGPTIYSSDSGWVETGMTWATRPAPIGEALDNKDRLSGDTWVEYDVTPAVTGDGPVSFVFVADSGDALVFSSREGTYPPELEIALANASPSTATPAATASAEPQVLVGAGDISSCDNDNDELTAQLLDQIPGTVFTTGDNAYDAGTPDQYLRCYAPTWGRHKDRTKPVPGNHEYGTPNAAGYFEYFDNIPPYYAYDLGSWRIYALDSEIDVSEESAQVQWLLQDLAANPRQCVLAYWHTPRWSSGAVHGNDRTVRTLWRTFYEAGAELVLNGHEHSYERFAPMDGDGLPNPQGLREIVVGNGGRSLYGFDAPLPTTEIRDNISYGVLKVTLYDTGYDWEFIPAAGSTFTDRGSGTCH